MNLSSIASQRCWKREHNVGAHFFLLWCSIFGSDASYYRTRRGERPITPALQEKILECVRAAGGNPNVGFDRYTTVTVYKG